MSWAILSEILVAVLKQLLGELAAELARRLLPTQGTVVLVSPDRLREEVRAGMTETIRSTRRPLLMRRAVAAFMTRFNGWVVSRVWDELHAKGYTAASADQFPKRLFAEPVDPVDEAMAMGIEVDDQNRAGGVQPGADDTRELPAQSGRSDRE